MYIRNTTTTIIMIYDQYNLFINKFIFFLIASPSQYTSPLEAIVVGVLAACGLSLFGIPLLLMLLNLFSLNANPGVSVIPTATTSVNTGRRKRSPVNLLDQHLFTQVIDSLNTFLQSEQKMQLLQRLIS